MSSDFGVYNIEGRLETTATASFQFLKDPETANLNERNLALRDARDDAEFSEGRQAGNNLQFTQVIPDMSSSDHEVSSLNAFYSGTQALEVSENAASANLYYSKQNRLVKKTYYLTASAGLPGALANEQSPSSAEFGGGRSTFISVSGSYRNNSYWNPAEFEIDVPDYGKIRDVKVWLELIHDNRIVSSSSRQGLQGIQVSLKSPNVYFENAHPLWNEETLKNNPKDIDLTIGNYNQVPKLLKNSYLLWAGHAVERDLGTTLGSATASLPDEYFESQNSFMLSQSGNFTNPVDNAMIHDIHGLKSLCVGKNNIPHVFFYDFDGSSLFIKEAKLTPTAWVSSSIQNSTMELTTGAGVSRIKSQMKSDGEKIVVVHDSLGISNKYLKIFSSSFTSSMWSSRSLETEQITYYDNLSNFDFKIDKKENICLTYTAPSGCFFMNEANNFNCESVYEAYLRTETSYALPDEPSQLQDEVSLTFDSNNIPVIAFSAQNEKKIYVFSSSSSGWGKKMTISSDDQFLKSPNIAFDSFDNLHVVYSKTIKTSVLKRKAVVCYVMSSSSGISNEQILNGPVSLVQESDRKDMITNLRLESRTPRIIINKKTNFPIVYWNDFKGNFFSIDDTGLKKCFLKICEFDENGFSIRNALSFDSSHASLTFPSGSFYSADVKTDKLGNIHVIYNKSEDGTFTFNKEHTYLISSGALQISFGTFKGAISSSTRNKSLYHSFNTDVDMRTVFTDGSKISNPRHNRISENKFSAVKLINEFSYASPSSKSLEIFKHLSYNEYYPLFNTDNYMSGTNNPWFIDSGTTPGWLSGKNYSFATASDGSIITNTTGSASVPDGWLTGPNKTAAVNEWPTKGMSLGPNDIRPVYPLLDDVWVEKVIDQPSLTSVQAFPTVHKKLVGFRPGLRGTEVHGKWKLMIGNNADWNGSIMVGGTLDGFWFRQLRLEFLLDQGEETTWKSFPSKNSRFKKSGNISSRPGQRLFEVISGSAAWDIGTNYIFVSQPEDHGRSYGISANDETTDFAVIASITGSYYNILSGSGKLSEVQSTFLNNEFGTPYIPLSSGSAEIPSYNPFTVDEITKSNQLFNDILNPKTLTPNDNTLKAFVSRSGVIKTRRDLALRFVTSGSL